MALLTIENLSFSYGEQPILRDVTFSIDEGQFIALCGATGSGKSTLLKLLKKELQPAGAVAGTRLFQGELLEKADPHAISFVMQKPDEQLMMEKVWQELAFPLENKAMPQEEMEQTIAEVMYYLDIHTLFDRRIATLSGGQKQLVNLAAALVTKPKLLLLDEPTAQLDPIAATQFIALLGRIHRELGMTIVIVEHQLEECLALLDEVMLLEQQTITKKCAPQQLIAELTDDTLLPLFGTAPHIYRAVNAKTIPLTIQHGKTLLPKLPLLTVAASTTETPAILQATDLYMRYEKKGRDLLAGVHLNVLKGSSVAILGGNGSGKSTLLQTLAGILKPYKGRMMLHHVSKQAVSLLPQNPQAMFMKATVADELQAMASGSDSAFEARKQAIVEQLQLAELLGTHPHDLSGGQQQLVAFAKLYLLNTPIMLLDEPTKGLGVHALQLLQQAIRQLQAAGTTFIMVTHDLQFAAACATHCTMLFEGKLTNVQPVRTFFCTNHFYTTAARRMTAHYTNAITAEEVIALWKQGERTNA